jgi:hypothetical protein
VYEWMMCIMLNISLTHEALIFLVNMLFIVAVSFFVTRQGLSVGCVTKSQIIRVKRNGD